MRPDGAVMETPASASPAQPAELRVLVLGSGGREHALVRTCLASPAVAEVFAAPGNGGMTAEANRPTNDRPATFGGCLPVNAEDPAAVVALARELAADFVIVGPEAPLAAGVADALRAAGIVTYGPGQAAAQLEASKAFCKAFLARHQIPTARYAPFTAAQLDDALAYLAEQPLPVVVKASGLAAGKGVVICETREAAVTAARDMLAGDAFGASGREIVVEECLTGPEVSLMLMIGGPHWRALPYAQDHKRIGEGDTGPNTGGMGAYAPAPVVTPALAEEIEQTVIEPTMAGLAADGLEVRGTLFVGLMLTSDGPKVLEFNVRFGDPETQVLLPLAADDLVPVLWQTAMGALPTSGFLPTTGDSAMVVVLASAGYPGTYPKGEPINLPPEAHTPQRDAIHAGTKTDASGQLVTSGGRVLGAVGIAPTLAAARDEAYALADAISFPGKTLRRDIGWRALA